jgi:hypothetical protein
MKTIDEIREAFFRVHRYATGRSDRAYMSIPADPERDADLIVCAAIDELGGLREALALAEHERDLALHRAADAEHDAAAAREERDALAAQITADDPGRGE